jgi:ABC-type antimicrobial peptide transport system permease subunit
MEAMAEPEMYVDYRQVPRFSYGMTVVARGGTPAASLVPAVRQRLRALHPGVAFVTGTLQERFDRTLANRRFVMSVLSGFSVLALMLAAIGLYAVLAYSVSRRARELAVRTALGATRRQLLWLVGSSAARVVMAGVAVGLVAATLLSRAMRVFLVDIVPFDMVSFSVAGALLLLIAVGVTLVPALRAVQADPASTLQQE